MKCKYVIVFLACAFLLAWAGCAKQRLCRETLQVAESLMEERPDSALVLIRSIDTTAVRRRADKALYALLSVQAEDKNYIDTKNETKIRVAVNFYDGTKDKFHQMLAYYYLARIEENAGKNAQAIVHLMQAEALARELQDNYYLGLICRSCANIYSNVYCYTESLSYAELAYDSFKEAGKERHELWALHDLGVVYNNKHDYDSSIRIQQQVIDQASTRGEKALYMEALRSIGISYLARYDYEESMQAYLALMEENMDQMAVEDYRNLGVAYVGLGDVENAIPYMEKVAAMDSTQQWLPYLVNKSLGNYRAALAALECELDYHNSVLLRIIQQDITHVVSIYHDSVLQLRRKEQKQERLIMLLLLSFLVVVLVLSIVIARLHIKGKKKAIEKTMLEAANLRDILQIKETEAECMSATINVKNAEAQSMQLIIDALFEQRFAVLDNLTRTYYECQGTPNEKQKVYHEVTTLISEFGSAKDVISGLENFVNTYKDNLMTRFRNDFPELGESDKLLFLYIVTGFSARAISVFINQSIEVVYNRKSRLRHKIDKSTVPGKEEYIRYFVSQ